LFPIRIQQGLDPDSIGSVDPDSITPNGSQKIKNLKKFMFEEFSEVLNTSLLGDEEAILKFYIQFFQPS
jgi:hypothetical protein